MSTNPSPTYTGYYGSHFTPAIYAASPSRHPIQALAYDPHTPALTTTYPSFQSYSLSSNRHNLIEPTGQTNCLPRPLGVQGELAVHGDVHSWPVGVADRQISDSISDQTIDNSLWTGSGIGGTQNTCQISTYLQTNDECEAGVTDYAVSLATPRHVELGLMPGIQTTNRNNTRNLSTDVVHTPENRNQGMMCCSSADFVSGNAHGLVYHGQQDSLNGSKPHGTLGSSIRYSGTWRCPSKTSLVTEELDTHTRTIIDHYLLRYLNYLCMNNNAVDRAGRHIHQQYSARRIERDELLFGWRSLKFRIEAFVNAFIEIVRISYLASLVYRSKCRTQLNEEGMPFEVTRQVPHYLSLSTLFSRFNESGNRMKSQGQNIWRVRARYRPIEFLTTTAHPPLTELDQSPFPPQNHHHGGFVESIGLGYAPDSTSHMLCNGPLPWEFLPYERSIVGQPPSAMVGIPWQWSLRLHDPWASRKKVQWKLVIEDDPRFGSAGDIYGNESGSESRREKEDRRREAAGMYSSWPLSTTMLSTSWLSIRNSLLVGTPSQAGSYPICIEASCEEDEGSKAESIAVRGSFTIHVSEAMTWRKGTELTLGDPNNIKNKADEEDDDDNDDAGDEEEDTISDTSSARH
ncbi:hypothetical protein FRC17_001264 [Serendipita sp. 399]|nr:hypothetical protein FRC17_001264 [Serendipita sp. 399]